YSSPASIFSFSGFRHAGHPWIVIASAAKQSPAAGASTEGDCFVAALLAMTAKGRSHGEEGTQGRERRGSLSGAACRSRRRNPLRKCRDRLCADRRGLRQGGAYRTTGAEAADRDA